MNHTLLYYPQLDFLAAIWAEGEPVTFQVGGGAGDGAALLAGVPGCLDGLVYEQSDILWSVMVVDSKPAKLLLDLGDFDKRVWMCGIIGIDGRYDFIDHRPPSFSALPGDVFDGFHHFSLVLFR